MSGSLPLQGPNAAESTSPPLLVRRVSPPAPPATTVEGAPSLPAKLSIIEPPPTAAEAGAPSYVDLAELTVRVAAYNLSLAGLAGQLQQELRSSAALAAHVEHLADLAARGADLQLYWNLAPPDARQAIGKLSPLDPTVALLGSKISAARRAWQRVQEEKPTRQTAAELERLDDLSRRLAELSHGHTMSAGQHRLHSPVNDRRGQ